MHNNAYIMCVVRGASLKRRETGNKPRLFSISKNTPAISRAAWSGCHHSTGALGKGEQLLS